MSVPSQRVKPIAENAGNQFGFLSLATAQFQASRRSRGIELSANRRKVFVCPPYSFETTIERMTQIIGHSIPWAMGKLGHNPPVEFVCELKADPETGISGILNISS